ncbi:MAG TPA: hypothetical protein VLH56_18925 [Dissulfurispiraceae bacterium]|nr:hypothetical protein [Dissulfurispiraceae bacterium]
MKQDWTFRFLAVSLVAVIAAYGASYGIRSSQVNIIDRQGAGSKFLMSSSGANLPGTCQVGDYFFKTDAVAGQNVFGCTALNTWTLQGDGVGGGVPAGTIAYFNLSGCPATWSEYTTLRGRYAVGLVSGGTLEGGSGTALTNQEARTVGQHNHTASQGDHGHTLSVTDSGHAHGVTDTGHTHQYGYYAGGQGVDGGFSFTAVPQDTITWGTTSKVEAGITINSGTANVSGSAVSASAGAITVANTGSVSGTSAPYLQLLACRKN